MTLATLVVLTLSAPGLAFALLGGGWLAGWMPRERTVARLTAACYLTAAAAAGALWVGMIRAGLSELEVAAGNWFQFGDDRFPLVLSVDRLSMPLVALSVVLVGLIGVFSVRYMHREPGFLRFFVLLHLFGFGILLLFVAGSFDLLVAGWELVGLTSVLLIAFFQERREPAQSALGVFAIYRACDVGLLTAVVMLHHFAGSTGFAELFGGGWPDGVARLTTGEAALAGGALLVAAMGKAAQAPFSGWLPRAMEGPTPSSAVFYGALSVHAGAYLLLRAQPLIAASTPLAVAVIVVGLLTAIHGTVVGRACADAKTSLAYASMTQLGVIFVEIGMGWNWLAVAHICGHAVVRTLQFLRAPSMLHDFHQVHAAAGGAVGEAGAHYEALIPERLRRWLYRLAFDRGHLDTVLDRYAAGALRRVAGAMARFEQRWLERAAPEPRPGKAVVSQLQGYAARRAEETLHG
jgi:NAD(P)H-quinone oxidoreductase subunit 5